MSHVPSSAPNGRKVSLRNGDELPECSQCARDDRVAVDIAVGRAADRRRLRWIGWGVLVVLLGVLFFTRLVMRSCGIRHVEGMCTALFVHRKGVWHVRVYDSRFQRTRIVPVVDRTLRAPRPARPASDGSALADRQRRNARTRRAIGGGVEGDRRAAHRVVSRAEVGRFAAARLEHADERVAEAPDHLGKRVPRTAAAHHRGGVRPHQGTDRPDPRGNPSAEVPQKNSG